MFLKASYKANIKYESKCIRCNRCNNFRPANYIGIKDEKLFLDENYCIGC